MPGIETIPTTHIVLRVGVMAVTIAWCTKALVASHRVAPSASIISTCRVCVVIEFMSVESPSETPLVALPRSIPVMGMKYWAFHQGFMRTTTRRR